MGKHTTAALVTLALTLALLQGCGGGGGGSAAAGIEAAMAAGDADSDSTTLAEDDSSADDAAATPDEAGEEPEGDTGNGPIDITNLILENSSSDCRDYAGEFTASVLDIQRSRPFTGAVLVSTEQGSCILYSNGIPNHDFNDDSARFASDTAAIEHDFEIPIEPALDAVATALSQRMYDAVFLNGVVLDLLSAGCYRPNSPDADADGNTPIGCNEDSPWLLDPMSPYTTFGTDLHNAHVQPDGRYHYHGDPEALFDDNPGPDGSPVIGFAADGFPVRGSYFLDPDTGAVRKAISGYTLKQGQRPASAMDPGGSYDGMYIDDYEFTDAGDLDACNGMTLDGQYAYYVTDSYPWVLGCLRGTPQDSFYKL